MQSIRILNTFPKVAMFTSFSYGASNIASMSKSPSSPILTY